ncbi:unnamed protein product [Dicrocoelium dendriticum]|nr:unnamed protein product [Dicrocoelium dendriticum]
MAESIKVHAMSNLELAHSSPTHNLADLTSVSIASAGKRGEVEQPCNDKTEKNGTCGSLTDLYFCGSSGPLELSSDSDRTSPNSVSVMTDRVQHIASGIYAEFEAMIETYGLPVVERLMPMVIGLLENLDELYKDRSAYLTEISQLREQYSFTVGELEKEKERRKLSELRLLQTEDAFDEEKKAQDQKIESLNAACRQTELRFQNMKDQVLRMEAKEADWKKTNGKLHERINELIRFNMDLTDQLKYSSRRKSTGGRAPLLRFGANAAPSCVLFQGDFPAENASAPSVPENPYDATSGGFGFDEMPSTEEIAPEDDELPAGMRKEIEVLIKENVELVETKNALNVVKDDLLAKVDNLTLENASLKESVTLLTQVRTNLQSELNSTDQLLGDARAEVAELKERISLLSRRFEDIGGSGHRKRFTRAEMSRVLSERNQYKERLMELQDAVRFTETLRAGQKGHPELLLSLSSPSNKCVTSGTQSPIGQSSASTRPLQTLQNFFSALASAQRQDSGKDGSITPTRNSTKFTSFSSHSWITLSRKHTDSPVCGWCNGLDYRNHKDTSVGNVPVPVPVQCRTIGGIHRHRLEIVSALVVPDGHSAAEGCHSLPCLWLIGRGPSQPIASGTPPKPTGRGLIGQVHIFEPHRLRHPLHQFELDCGFIPIAAALVHPDSTPLLSSPSLCTPSDKAASVVFQWEPTHISNSILPSAYVILSSNDGRFVVLRGSPISPLPESTATEEEKNAWIHARFSVIDAPLAANFLVSINTLVCISLSNPSGTSQLTYFNFSDVLTNPSSASTQLTFPLLPLPDGDSATGPMVMAAETHHRDSKGRVWLGTAGGGRCHCFLLQSGKFLNSLSLPPETPCLYAITLQPSTPDTPLITWLAVSGSHAAASVEGDSNASTALVDDTSRGIARIIGFDADKQLMLHHFDLTASLTTILDLDHVTDPVDLTICQLLYVPHPDGGILWFATRAGCIGRLLDVTITDPLDSCAKLEVPPSSTISISCHGYRRPVCNLITVCEPSSGESVQETLVISVGHDYAHLLPPGTSSPSHSMVDSCPRAVVLKGMNKLRQMGSGAHTIVWKLSLDPHSLDCNATI